MAVTTTVSALPAVPDRSMSSEAFVAAANAFLGALPNFRTQINAVASEINATGADVNGWATQAQAAATSAIASAASAINSPATRATYTGSLTVSAVSKTFQLDQADKVYSPGQYVAIADNAAAASRRMTGLVTAYDIGTRTITILVDNIDAGTGQTVNTVWNITVSARAGLPAATVQEIRAGVIASGTITPQGLALASAFTGLADAATIQWDTQERGWNVIVSLTTSRVMGAPTGLRDGWVYTLGIYQGAASPSTLSWDVIFDWGEAGPPALSVGVGKMDWAYGQYSAGTGKIHMNFRKAA